MIYTNASYPKLVFYLGENIVFSVVLYISLFVKWFVLFHKAETFVMIARCMFNA
jgi:hypothetical protein